MPALSSQTLRLSPSPYRSMINSFMMRPPVHGCAGSLRQSPGWSATSRVSEVWPPWLFVVASRHYRHLGIKNAIRPSAVGKKNWLFIGHPEAGWRSAVIYSVIVSCRRRGIDPWEYLREVLQRLPAMKQSEISSVLPARWKATAVHS